MRVAALSFFPLSSAAWGWWSLSVGSLVQRGQKTSRPAPVESPTPEMPHLKADKMPEQGIPSQICWKMPYSLLQ